MPRRTLLTDAQRAALLALPADEIFLIQHYTLSDDDRRLITRRRRPDTRLGLALQLGALRYHRLRRSVCEAADGKAARGAGCSAPASRSRWRSPASSPGSSTSRPKRSATSRRAPTRYEQLGSLRRTYGFVDLTHPHRRELQRWLLGVALVTTDSAAVVATFAEEMRRRRIVIPGITVLERLAAEVISMADNQLIKTIAGRLRVEQTRRLDVLCKHKAHERQGRFAPRASADARAFGNGAAGLLAAAGYASLPGWPVSRRYTRSSTALRRCAVSPWIR